jgi:hypothetical protein
MVCSYAVNKRRFEVMATGTRGGVLLERGVDHGAHGYRVVYEPHVAPAGAVVRTGGTGRHWPVRAPASLCCAVLRGSLPRMQVCRPCERML